MQDVQHPVLNRDDLLPRQPAGMGRGLMLAIAAHVLLVIAITFSVNWSSSDPAGVEAELWSAVPQIAARGTTPDEPAPPAPEPPKPEPRPEPKPVPKPVEAPPPPKPAPDPQIAIEKEKARKEKLQKEKEEKLREQQEQDRKDKLEKQKAEDKKAEEKKLAEKKKQDAAKQQALLEKQRQDQLDRIMKQAGGSANGSPTGQGAVTSGPSSTYAGRIRGAIEPNITFTSELNGNPTAEVEVRQGPDGTITGSRLVKSSGVKEWDDAVLRAVDKTQKLPRDIDGRVISPMIITFRPNK